MKLQSYSLPLCIQG